MQRIAIVLVGVAGCSSATPVRTPETMPVPDQQRELMTTRPRVTPTNVEPEPEPEIEIVDDWMPQELPPVATCLPTDVGARFALEDTALRACWNRGGDFAADPDACLWVGKDGTAWTGTPPAPVSPRGLHARVAADLKSAELCDAAGACKTLTPTLAAGQLVQQAVTDDDGTRAALLLHDGGAGDGTVAIYDARTGTMTASGTRRNRHHADVRYEIDFFGPAVLWVAYEDEDRGGKAEMWKTKREKLKIRKKLRGLAGEWARLGAGRFVVTDEKTRAEVWDAHQAKRIAKLHVRELGIGANREPETMLLAGDKGTFSMLVLSGTAAKVAFVDGTARHPEASVVDVPVCQ